MGTPYGLEAAAKISTTASPDEVFDYAAEVTNLSQWLQGVSDVEWKSDQRQEGAIFRSLYTWQGKTHDLDYQIEEFRRPERLVFATISGPFPFRETLTISPLADRHSGNQTEIEHRVWAGSDSLITTLIFWAGRRWILPLVHKRLDEEAAALKKALESS
ncbi:Hypothetical protein PBC10988_22230 [Planctomycetales bacterium 10988]|nr:Hypothetical protein PBC10988_22230 [Planctomycetales bacterium 10988]